MRTGNSGGSPADGDRPLRLCPILTGTDAEGDALRRRESGVFMKRSFCLILALLLTAALLAGCGNDKKGSSPSSQVSSAVPTVTPTAAPVQKAKAVLIKADSGLNVRGSASTDGEILGLADNGSKLALLVEDEKDGWYQVQYEGKSAYVSAEYVEVVEVTLEEYNRLKSGASSEGGESDGPQSGGSQTSSASSKPEESQSSKAPESSAPESSSAGDSEDGE